MSDQLICHAVGDYLLQSDWMAQNKTKRHLPAALHAITYALPFLLLKLTKGQLAALIGTHFLIDRYRLARYVCWAKNQAAPIEDRSMTATGYSEQAPPWMAVWLLIIADNTLHVVINRLVLGRKGNS